VVDIDKDELVQLWLKFCVLMIPVSGLLGAFSWIFSQFTGVRLNDLSNTLLGVFVVFFALFLTSIYFLAPESEKGRRERDDDGTAAAAAGATAAMGFMMGGGGSG